MNARAFANQSFISSAYEQEQKRRESLDGVQAGDRPKMLVQEQWNGEKWIEVKLYWDGKHYTERGARR